MRKISRRNFLLTAGVVSAAALLAACGSSTSSASSESASESTASSAESAASNEAVEYPITIQHAYGETVIEEKPESIVAIAWGNPDVPLALGVVPTGVSKTNFGPVNEDGLLPWTAAAFEKLGASPNVFSDTDGWDYEAISDCAPDVILAAYSGFSEEEYNMLSQIAPTVAYPSVAWSTTWREETIVDATAMGMKSEGEALVAETDAMIQKKLAEYPAIEGKKAAFFWLSASDLSTFYIYTTLDPRAAFLTDLGMPLPDSVAALDNGKDFALTVSAENANQFSDVEIIITYGTDELLTALQADPLLSEISAVKNGAVVLLDSSDDLAASSTPSILSIPYTIDRYLWQRKLYEEWAACDWNHSAGYDHFGRMYAGFRSIWFQSYSHRAGSAGSSKSRFRNF